MDKFPEYFGQKVNFSFLGDDRILSINNEESLGEGSVLYSFKTNKQVIVGKEITSSGGQGIIYEYPNTNYVIKLYRKEARTKYTERKLLKMIQYENHNPQICWPVDVLRDINGVFVGFIMPRVDGKNLYSLTTNPSRVMRKYQDYSRDIQINMLIQMVELFKNLHDINVIVGDVKLENVMFDPNNQYQVTLIDMDSVQVDQFPCDSSTPGYDAPEVILSHGSDKYADTYSDGTLAYNSYYKDFYRTMQHEQYALTVLIYRFLMNGQKPFDYQDWGKISDDDHQYNDDELCIKKQFAFGEDGFVSADAVEKSIWSHLPSFIKTAFVNSFGYNTRYSDDDWLKMLKRYKDLITSGRIKNADSNWENPFPEDVIDFDKVKFALTESFERSGFAMAHAVARIAKAMKEPWSQDKTVFISKALQHDPELIMDSYKFQLIYNIGVLKKVRCESVL